MALVAPEPPFHKQKKSSVSFKLGAVELAAVRTDFEEAVGPVPGGRWGSDIAWLNKKIAEAEAVDLTFEESEVSTAAPKTRAKNPLFTTTCARFYGRP